MKIEDVKVVKGPLVTASTGDVEALEARLWLAFPEGYRDYVARLGEGFLCDFIRIYPPWRIEEELDAWRRRIARCWLWDGGPRLLPKERAVECVPIGDTLNGDELVFHPSRPGRLFVLPHDEDEVFEAGADLLSAIDWMLNSGRLTDDAPRPPEFEAFDSRLTRPDEGGDEPVPTVADPPGGSMNELVDAVRAWADRHRVREEADRFLAQYNPKARFGMTAARRCEAIVFEAAPASGFHVGYMAIYGLSDEKAGRKGGSIVFHRSDDGFSGGGPLS